MRKYIYVVTLLLLAVLEGCKNKPTNAVAPTPQVPLATPQIPPVGVNTNTTIYYGTVESALRNYLTLLKNFDTDGIVQKTYPTLFTVINEQHFREYISTMMHSKDIMIEKYETQITDFGHLKAFSNGTKFVQVGYRSTAKIIFLNDNLYNNTNSINFLYDVLIHKYGKENIEMNVANRSLKITRNEKLIMIQHLNQEWQFIGDTPEYRRLYPKILPYEVLSNLEG